MGVFFSFFQRAFNSTVRAGVKKGVKREYMAGPVYLVCKGGDCPCAAVHRCGIAGAEGCGFVAVKGV